MCISSGFAYILLFPFSPFFPQSTFMKCLCEQYYSSHRWENQGNKPANPSQNQNKTVPRKKKSVISEPDFIMSSQNSDNWTNCGLFCLFYLISCLMSLFLIISGRVEPQTIRQLCPGWFRASCFTSLILNDNIFLKSRYIYIYFIKASSS